MATLRETVRRAVEQLEKVGPEGVEDIVRPIRQFVRPDVHVGWKGDWTDDMKVEWYAGQILSIVDAKAWFAMNSILNGVDKWCPEAAPTPAPVSAPTAASSFERVLDVDFTTKA